MSKSFSIHVGRFIHRLEIRFRLAICRSVYTSRCEPRLLHAMTNHLPNQPPWSAHLYSSTRKTPIWHLPRPFYFFEQIHTYAWLTLLPLSPAVGSMENDLLQQQPSGKTGFGDDKIVLYLQIERIDLPATFSLLRYASLGALAPVLSQIER